MLHLKKVVLHEHELENLENSLKVIVVEDECQDFIQL